MLYFLHRDIVRSCVPGHRLHVRVDKASDLQIFFSQDGISKSNHQTHGQLALKQHKCSNHTEFWIEFLLHEQLNSHILDLIHKRLDVNKTA